LAMSGFLLVNAMLGVRNIPLWLLTAQKVWGEYYPRLAKEVGSGKEQKRRFNRAKKIITGIFILLFCIQAYSYTVSMLAQQEEKTYPKKAIEYLKKNPKEGNLFSEYGWGGYLIWKYPEKKTFVDGRMAIWRWNQKDKRFLNDAYGTYLDIMNGEKTLIPYLQKYHITRLILPTPQKTTVHPIILKLRALLQPRGKTILKINYPIEYQDETATIYKTN